MEKDQLTLYALEDYPASIGYVLAAMQKERERTYQLVAELSTEQLDKTVATFENSIGSLLYHIADIELDWLYSEILEQDTPQSFAELFPIVHRDEHGKLSVVANQSAIEHMQRLTAVRNELLDKLKGMDETEFYRVRQLEPYDVNPAWVLYHLLEHECKHAEQIAHMCRLMN